MKNKHEPKHAEHYSAKEMVEGFEEGIAGRKGDKLRAMAMKKEDCKEEKDKD